MNFILAFIGPLSSDEQLINTQLVRKFQVRFEVPSVILLKIQVFWDVTLCQWGQQHGVTSQKT